MLLFPPKTQTLRLDEDHQAVVHRRVETFVLDREAFADLWQQHPAEYHEVLLHGRRVKTPRWQQAYGHTYAYTGSRNDALPLTPYWDRYLEWCRTHVDERLNGLLVNWYDGRLKHYIGKHRDSPRGLAPGTPIVTISHGGTRLFRFRPFGNPTAGATPPPRVDTEVNNGDVIVIPWATNRSWTHEVPHFARFVDRRVSVTVRGFG